MITFTKQQQAWLDTRISSGEFTSADEAIGHLIDIRIAEETDDLSWAKSLVDDAKAAVSQGEVISLDEHKARNASRLAALGD